MAVPGGELPGDREWHNFAQNPREAPVRSGLGAAAIALMVVLFLAGSNDVLAKYLQIEVDTFNTVLGARVRAPGRGGRGDVLVCRDLHDRPRNPWTAGSDDRAPDHDGGFEEIHEPRAVVEADDEVGTP